MTSPVRNSYQACNNCTAKWFAAKPVRKCPRCGAQAGTAVDARPPWAGRESLAVRKVEKPSDGFGIAAEFLRTVPANQRFHVVVAALRTTLPFDSEVTRQLFGLLHACWNEVSNDTWPDTMPIVLQLPLRHSTQSHVQRLASQPDEQCLRELLTHLAKRCQNDRLITVSRVYREVCRILRHTAGKHRLYIDPDGWVSADALLKVINQRSLEFQLWRDWRYSDLQKQASLHANQRLHLHGGAVRTSYGHSLPDVCAGYRHSPPPTLFHGTSVELLPAILRDGLLPAERTLLHLTSDSHYASEIALRHAVPTVLVINAEHAAQQKTIFWKCNSHVWQCCRIAPEFIVGHQPDSEAPADDIPSEEQVSRFNQNEKGRAS